MAINEVIAGLRSAWMSCKSESNMRNDSMGVEDNESVIH